MTTIGAAVGRLVTWLDHLMPPGDRRTTLTSLLTNDFGADGTPLTAAGCASVERRAWTVSRHVALIYEPDGTDGLSSERDDSVGRPEGGGGGLDRGPAGLPGLLPAVGESPSALGELPSALGELPSALGELPSALRELPPALGEPAALRESPPALGEPAWPPPDVAAVRRRAAAVAEVRRLDDGTGLVRLDGLDPIGLAQPYVDAAITLLRGADRIVLDLRANGGGDPATVALIAGWLLGDESVKLSDVVYRTGVRQWWTPDRPPGTALRQPAWVLVGPGTFSSGEALAYHLQSHGRVTVVGAATPGAADHVLPVRLAPTVLAHVPHACVVDAVTGRNWEGSGVIPDVACPADEALDRALALAS